MKFWIEAVGWIGTALIVGAFAAISYHLVDAGLPYQIANAVGSTALGIQLYTKRAWPPFSLQIIWTAIAVAAIVRMQWPG